MFAIAGTLVAAMVIIEIMLVRAYPRLGHFLEKHPGRSLLFSFGLSVALGIIIPAAGLIVFVAGVTSTVITQPYYAAMRRWSVFKTHSRLWAWHLRRQVR